MIEVNSKTKKIQLFFLIIMIATLNQSFLSINDTNLVLASTSTEVFSRGDYLIYDVSIFRILYGDETDVFFRDPDDSSHLITLVGQLRFDITDVNQNFVEIRASFHLETSEDQGNIDLSDQVRFYLQDNQIYINGTLWGYLPFVYPRNTPEERRVYSGIVGYSHTMVYEDQPPHESYSETIFGFQPTIVIETTAASWKSTQDGGFLIYVYDSGVGIAYSIDSTDPWWSIFPKDFEIAGTRTSLIESNIYFGPSDEVVRVFFTFSYFLFPILVLIIVLVVLISAYYLCKLTHRK